MLHIRRVEHGGGTHKQLAKDIELSPSRSVVVWKADGDAYGILTKFGDDKMIIWFTHRLNIARSYVNDCDELCVVSSLTKFELVVQQ